MFAQEGVLFSILAIIAEKHMGVSVRNLVCDVSRACMFCIPLAGRHSLRIKALAGIRMPEFFRDVLRVWYFFFLIRISEAHVRLFHFG